VADEVNINTAYDVIEVVDPTTLVPITITEESIHVGSGMDEVTVVTDGDTVAVVEGTEVISITDELVNVQPTVEDVQVQIVEDSEVPYAKRTDFVGETIIYKGEAAVGAVESDPVWRLRKLDIATDGDVKETWAAGAATFDKVWDDRATEVYI